MCSRQILGRLTIEESILRCCLSASSKVSPISVVTLRDHSSFWRTYNTETIVKRKSTSWNWKGWWISEFKSLKTLKNRIFIVHVLECTECCLSLCNKIEYSAIWTLFRHGWLLYAWLSPSSAFHGQRSGLPQESSLKFWSFLIFLFSESGLAHVHLVQ